MDRKTLAVSVLFAAALVARGDKVSDDVEAQVEKLSPEDLENLRDFATGNLVSKPMKQKDWNYYTQLLNGWRDFEDCKPCLRECMALFDWAEAEKSGGMFGKWSGAGFHMYKCAMEECHCMSDQTWARLTGEANDDSEESEDAEVEPEDKPATEEPEEVVVGRSVMYPAPKIEYKPPAAPATESESDDYVDPEMQEEVKEKFEACKPCFEKCMHEAMGEYGYSSDPMMGIMGAIDCLSTCNCFDEDTLNKWWDHEELPKLERDTSPATAGLDMPLLMNFHQVAKKEKPTNKVTEWKQWFEEAYDEWKDINKCKPCLDECLEKGGYAVKTADQSWFSFMTGYSLNMCYCLVNCECVTKDRFDEAVEAFGKWRSQEAIEDSNDDEYGLADDENDKEEAGADPKEDEGKEEEFFDAEEEVTKTE